MDSETPVATSTIAGLTQGNGISTTSIEVSIVVPTKNEAGNLSSLLERIGSAMAGRAYEVIVVDDGSQDGTPEVCQRLSRAHPLTLWVRSEPIGGLSGAVLHGFSKARGEILVVMDADLQHPPERLSALISPLVADQADFVVGSRRAPGGCIAEKWGLGRRLQSRIATLLAMPLTQRVHDAMSGFFALRRSTYQAASGLDPLGYKIGLELLCKCSAMRVLEVPIDFGVRLHGHSKLTFSKQLAYVRHLARLYAFQYPAASIAIAFHLGLLILCLSLAPIGALVFNWNSNILIWTVAASAMFYSLVFLAWRWRHERTRGVLAAIAAFYTSLAMILLATAYGHEFVRNLSLAPSSPKPGIIKSMASWDGEWYMRIATDGYDLYSRLNETSIVFFPAYPLLAKALMRLIGVPAELALIIVSNLFLLAALVLLERYLRDRSMAPLSERVTAYSLWSMALFPAGCFFHMAYTESMLIFLLVLAMYAMRRKWPLEVIALIIGAATATRSVGIALCLPFVSHLWKTTAYNSLLPGSGARTTAPAKNKEQHRRQITRFALRGLLLMPLACWGLLGFIEYQTWKFGTPLAFVDAQAAWRVRAVPENALDRAENLIMLEPVRAVYTPQSPAYWGRHAPRDNPFLNLLFANPIFFLVTLTLIIIGAIKRWLNDPELLLSVPLLLIPYIMQANRMGMTSQARFASVVFPAYIVIGHLLARVPTWVAVPLLCLGAFMMAAYAALFTSGYWFF